MVSEPPVSKEREARSYRQTARVGLIAVIGLLLAINALGPSETASGQPTHFIIHLPDWITGAIVAVLATAALIVLAPLMPKGRRRPKDDEPPEVSYDPPKFTVGALIMLVLLAVAPLCLILAAVWFSHDLPSSSHPPAPAPLSEAPAGQEPPPPSGPPGPAEAARVHSTAANAILATVAIVFAVVALGIVLWFRFGDRLARRPINPLREQARALDSAVGQALEDLRLEPNVRRAIVTCYARFERSLNAAGYGRRPSDTPIETMHRALQHLRLPDDAVNTLTRLFEIARFSLRDVTAVDRDAAWQALVLVKAHLEERGGDASAS